jgi:uncharacterized protein YukE
VTKLVVSLTAEKSYKGENVRLQSIVDALNKELDGKRSTLQRLLTQIGNHDDVQAQSTADLEAKVVSYENLSEEHAKLLSAFDDSRGR